MVVIHGPSRIGIEPDVETRHAGVRLKGGEVAAGAEGADCSVPCVEYGLAGEGGVGGRDLGGHFVEERVQERGRGGGEERAADADVDVEICEGCAGEPREVVFDPLGAA